MQFMVDCSAFWKHESHCVSRYAVGYWFEHGPIKAQHGVETDFLPARRDHHGIVIKDLAGNSTTIDLPGHLRSADDPQDGNTWIQLPEALTSK